MIAHLGAALLALALATAPVVLVPDFDLPLMPGLAEQVDARVAFDRFEGRILETQLTGSVSLTDARAYYAGAAAGLGWAPVDGAADGPLRFERGGDRLTIEFVQQDGLVLVRLMLEPSGK